MYGHDTTTVAGWWNFKSSTGSFGESFQVDLDRNGFSDFIANDRVYLNAATAQETVYPIPNLGRRVGIADVDGDGLVDVLSSGSISFGDGVNALVRIKFIKDPDYSWRSNYRINYMDTLGGKIVFLSSWSTERVPQGGSYITIAIESLDPLELSAAGDTVSLSTIRTFKFTSYLSALGAAPLIVYDDVWYMLTGSDEFQGKYIAITKDTFSLLELHPSFFIYKGSPRTMPTIQPNSVARGSVIEVIDGKQPCLISSYKSLDSSWSMRYALLKSQLETITIGEMNLNVGPGGKTVSTRYAFAIADVDGDGLEDVCNPVQLPGGQVWESLIYTTKDNVVSSVFGDADPKSLESAKAVPGGWLLPMTANCLFESGLLLARVYDVSGRLLATLDLQYTTGGSLLPVHDNLRMQGLKIAVIGECTFRLL